MSNEALTAVSKAKIRPSGRKFVAMALADYADEAWSCFPSVEQLAEYTGQGEKTVRDHLDALESDGIITRKRHRREDGTLGRYRFIIHRRKLPVANFARGEKPPEPPADFATHNPHIEPSISVSKGAREKTPREELGEVLNAEHADAVLDHRQRIRKPLTAYAAKLLARQLAEWPNPNEAADAMIANGWQGFKPEWLAKRRDQQPPKLQHRNQGMIEAFAEIAREESQ